MQIEAVRQRLLNANVPETIVEQEIAHAVEVGASVEFIVNHLTYWAVIAEQKLENEAGRHIYMSQFNE